MLGTLIGLSLTSAAPPPLAGSDEVERGLAGALRGCEEWVLRPNSWANGPKPFIAAVGLGSKLVSVDHVADVNLPPLALRVANHYWKINSTSGAGFVLVVSDRLPMCHITGSGDVDMQPAVSALLTSTGFKSRWAALGSGAADDMMTSRFRNVEEPNFIVTISRAQRTGERLDRIQVLATATFSTSGQ